jgi:uncharacterized membrane protein
LFFQNLGLNTWLLFALIALLFWGLFSAAQKVTTNYISAEWSYMSFIASSILISFAFMSVGVVDMNFSWQTLWIGALAGMLNGLGVLASFAAYRAEGKASKVTAIAGSLQPVFTIVLAIVFLKENLDFIEIIGISLAIIGSILLSIEKRKSPGNNPIES